MKRQTFAVTILTLLLLRIAACASSIINFTGNDTGTTTTNFTGFSSGTWNGGVYSVPYANSALVFSGDIQAGAPTLYGGVYGTSSGVQNGPTVSFNPNSTGTDRIQLGWNAGSTASTPFRFMLMAPSSGWLSLTSGASFDPASSLSISTLGTNQTGVTSLNFVVEDAGIYYMSTQRLATTSGTLTVSDPDSALWTIFDPSQTNFGGIDPTSLSGNAHIFSDIEAIGFFLQGQYTGSAGTTGTAYVGNWAVSAVPEVVPEPSSGALMILGGIFLIILAKRFSVRLPVRQPPSDKWPFPWYN